MLETRLTTTQENRASGRKALRALGWQELTARINAARELREVLRSDCVLTSASFGDAAAGYFAASEDGKPTVNPDALEGRKIPQGMDFFSKGETEKGAEKNT